MKKFKILKNKTFTAQTKLAKGSSANHRRTGGSEIQTR